MTSDEELSDRWNEAMRRRYVCQRVAKTLTLTENTRDPGWAGLPWSQEFVDITGRAELQPRFRTRVRMGWDDRYLYVNAEMEEPHVWGTITKKNAVMFEDNDFEIFIDPDSDGLNYYEFEVNALGSIWELSLPKPYGDGGKPKLGCNIGGLISRVRVDGTLNDPGDLDRGWGVEVAIPWSGLKLYQKSGQCPPVAGDCWRFNFSRVQWQHKVENGGYIRIPPHGTPIAESLNPEEQDHPEDNWVWSPQGVVNMHLPTRWGDVIFE